MSSHTPRSTYRENYTARSVSGASISTSRLSTSRRAKLEKMRAEASGDRERKRYKLQAVLKDKLVCSKKECKGVLAAVADGDTDAALKKMAGKTVLTL